MSEPSKADAAIAAALVEARDLTGAAEKDGFNEHGQYAYASADGVVATARGPLKAARLNVVPTGSSITLVGNTLVLNRKLRIYHAEGAYIECETAWPVVVRGKDPGKGAAAAETTSYSYFLKTMLDMRRGPQDDQDHGSNEPVAPPVQMMGAGASKLLERICAAGSLKQLIAARDFIAANQGKLSEFEVEQLSARITERMVEYGP
jgi:hypothetical protein